MGSYVCSVVFGARTVPLLRVKFLFAKILPQYSIPIRSNFTGVLETDSLGGEKKSSIVSKSRNRAKSVSSTKSGNKKEGSPVKAARKKKRELKRSQEKNGTNDEGHVSTSGVAQPEKRKSLTYEAQTNSADQVNKEIDEGKAQSGSLVQSGLNVVASNLMKFFCDHNNSPHMVEKYHTVLKRVKRMAKQKCDSEEKGMEFSFSVEQDMCSLNSERKDIQDTITEVVLNDSRGHDEGNYKMTMNEEQIMKLLQAKDKKVEVESDAASTKAATFQQYGKTSKVIADESTAKNGHKLQSVMEPNVPRREESQSNESADASMEVILSYSNQKREKIVAANGLKSGHMIQGKTKSQEPGSAIVDNTADMVNRIDDKAGDIATSEIVMERGTDLSSSKGKKESSDGIALTKVAVKESEILDSVGCEVAVDKSEEVHSKQGFTDSQALKCGEEKIWSAVASTKQLLKKRSNKIRQKGSVVESTGISTWSGSKDSSIKAEEVLGINSKVACGEGELADSRQPPSRTSMSTKSKGKEFELTGRDKNTHGKTIPQHQDNSLVELETTTSQSESSRFPVSYNESTKKEKEITPNDREIYSGRNKAGKHANNRNGYGFSSKRHTYVSRDLTGFLNEWEETKQMEAKYKEFDHEGSMKEDHYSSGFSKDEGHPNAEGNLLKSGPVPIQLPITNRGTDLGGGSGTNDPCSKDVSLLTTGRGNDSADCVKGSTSRFSSRQRDFKDEPLYSEDIKSNKKLSRTDKEDKSGRESNFYLFPFEGSFAEGDNKLSDYEVEADNSSRGVRYYKLAMKGSSKLRFPSVTTVLEHTIGKEKKRLLKGWRINQIKKVGLAKHNANISSILDVGTLFHKVRARSFVVGIIEQCLVSMCEVSVKSLVPFLNLGCCSLNKSEQVSAQ